jgi:hypothetical protein
LAPKGTFVTKVRFIFLGFVELEIMFGCW